MAKKEPATLGGKLGKAIAALKRPFMAFATDYGKLAESRAELAPKLMRVFGSFLKEQGGSFVDFVRLIDPDVPAERAEYRAHRSYQAADYLRRLVGRRDTGANRAKPVRSNLAAMARLLATIQPIALDVEKLWTGIESEFGLTKRQVGKLRQIVAVSQPLFKIPNIKPLRVNIVHVSAPAVEAAQSARQAGRGTARAA